MRHDSFLCATWLIPMHHVFHCHTSHSPGSSLWNSGLNLRLTDMCDMTHSYALQASSPHSTQPWQFVTHWTHTYVRHDSFLCMTWLIPTFRTALAAVCERVDSTNDSMIDSTISFEACRGMPVISHMTHSYAQHYSSSHWLRFIESYDSVIRVRFIESYDLVIRVRFIESYDLVIPNQCEDE